ncbi:hypothetical protein T459_31615 [Capsicum annuum]|uniref:Ska2 N-terminal domain-containing protein n=1 Tax=Capsicum annuum TaxID=4072 RepID=A0A2G2Y460_CAPAN|nr:hypothetical protein T459_31615 [Capsicum annuum]
MITIDVGLQVDIELSKSLYDVYLLVPFGNAKRKKKEIEYVWHVVGTRMCELKCLNALHVYLSLIRYDRGNVTTMTTKCQDLIDKARATLVGNGSLLQKLQLSAGVPVTSDSDDPSYASFNQIGLSNMKYSATRR